MKWDLISGSIVSKPTDRPTIEKQMSMTLEIVSKRVEELEKRMAQLEQLVSAKPVKETKTTKKSPKKEKPEGEPKKRRAMTGYLLFARERRAEVKEQLGDVKPTEVITEVAKQWKALTDEEREGWNTRAKEVDVSDD